MAKKEEIEDLEKHIQMALPNYSFYKNALKARRKTTDLKKLH